MALPSCQKVFLNQFNSMTTILACTAVPLQPCALQCLRCMRWSNAILVSETIIDFCYSNSCFPNKRIFKYSKKTRSNLAQENQFLGESNFDQLPLMKKPSQFILWQQQQPRAISRRKRQLLKHYFSTCCYSCLTPGLIENWRTRTLYNSVLIQQFPWLNPLQHMI